MLVQTAKKGKREQKNVERARQKGTSLIRPNSSKKGIKTLPRLHTKKAKPPPPKWLPHQQKCAFTKCRRLAQKENATWTGSGYLFYCQFCFKIVSGDMKRPAAWATHPRDFKPYQWPKPGYKKTKQHSKQWNKLTKSLFTAEKETRPKTSNTQMPAWEDIQPKTKKAGK